MDIQMPYDMKHCRPYKVDVPSPWKECASGSPNFSAYTYKKSLVVTASINSFDDGEYICLCIMGVLDHPTKEEVNMATEILIGKDKELVDLIAVDSIVENFQGEFVWCEVKDK